MHQTFRRSRCHGWKCWTGSIEAQRPLPSGGTPRRCDGRLITAHHGSGHERVQGETLPACGHAAAQRSNPIAPVLLGVERDAGMHLPADASGRTKFPRGLTASFKVGEADLFLVRRLFFPNAA